jgi:hypothetical protein
MILLVKKWVSHFEIYGKSDIPKFSFNFHYNEKGFKIIENHVLAIWLKPCITFSCNIRKNATLVYTQQRLSITFVLSNNLHYVDSTCKVVHLVMVLIGMNCC